MRIVCTQLFNNNRTIKKIEDIEIAPEYICCNKNKSQLHLYIVIRNRNNT